MLSAEESMTFSTVLAAIAALVSALTSVLAIGVAYYTFRQTVRAAARPVLVFSLTSRIVWQVQNVGTGPAVRVTIGAKWLSQDWGTVVTCHSLGAGAVTPLPWIHEGTEIAAVYTDVFSQSHTTRCIDGNNEVLTGNRFRDWRAQWTEWELQLVNDETLLLYTEDQLRGKTPFELDIMRNEFYA